MMEQENQHPIEAMWHKIPLNLKVLVMNDDGLYNSKVGDVVYIKYFYIRYYKRFGNIDYSDIHYHWSYTTDMGGAEGFKDESQFMILEYIPELSEYHSESYGPMNRWLETRNLIRKGIIEGEL